MLRILCLLVLLAGPVSAATAAEAHAFFAKIGRLLLSGQHDQVVEAVTADPTTAEACFQQVLEAGARRPRLLQGHKRALNAVAAVFESRLDRPELREQLQTLNLLANELELSDYLGASADDPGLAALDLNLRAGNYRGALEVLRKLNRQDPLFQTLTVVALEGSGQAGRALVVGEHLPAGDLYAQMALLAAARAAHRTDLVEKLIPRCRALAQDELTRFTLDGWEAELRPPQDLLEAHQQAWAHFPKTRVESLKPGQARWACQAARYWVGELAHQAQLAEPDSPEFQRLADLIVADLATLHAQTGERDANLEFAFGLFDIALDCVEALAQTGNTAETRKALTKLAPFVALAQTTVAALEKKARGRATLSDYPISIVNGEFSRAAARYQQSWIRLLLAEGNRDLAAYQPHLRDAHAHQERARAGQGFRGLEEVAWDELALRLRVDPASAGGLADRLLARCREIEYRPGIVQALMARGGPEDLRAAAALLETGVVPDGGPTVRRRFMALVNALYDRLAVLAVQEGRSQEAFALVNRGRQIEALPSSPELTRAADEIRALEQELVVLNEEAPVDPEAQARLETVTRELADTREEFVALARELRTEGTDSNINPLDMTRFQQLLPAGTVVLQIVPGEQTTCLLIVTPTSFRAVEVGAGAARLSELVLECRRSIARQADPSAALAQLYSLLVEPAAAELGGAEVLVVVPAGPLHYLPFQALGKAGPEGRFEHLIERMQVVVLAKASDFLCLSGPTASPVGSLVAVGDPDGTLPGAAAEARAVAAFFPQSQVLLGDQAVPSRLTGQPRVLHLATHGVLNNRNPEASYLVMGQGVKLDHDGIVRLPLGDTRLVTLSACDTALGEGQPGREVTSLAESFWTAGSANTAIVCSLWQVRDESTRRLMTAFYRGLREENLPMGEALRRAQLELLSSADSRHPYHWSAFTLWGDWR